MNVERQLDKLHSKGFDFRNLILQGSVVLALLDIVDESEVNDIDGVVSREGFDFLKNEMGWRETVHPETQSRRLQDRGKNFDLWDEWYDGENLRSFWQMSKRAHPLKGYKAGCVRKDIRTYKTRRMDKLDGVHIEGINAFTSDHRSYYVECLVAPHVNNIQQVGEVVSDAVDIAVGSVKHPVRALGHVATFPQRVLDRSA